VAFNLRERVESTLQAGRKQVESQLQTCLKPSDDRTSRLIQQVREEVFDKNVESMSQTRTVLSTAWLQSWSKARFAARFAAG